MSKSVDSSSFWTTIPGLMTGSAALITALATAFALLTSGGNVPDRDATASGPAEVQTAGEPSDAPLTDSPQPRETPPDAAPEVTDPADVPADPPAAAGPSDEYLLREDGGIDVDSGQFGSGVEEAELRWGGSYVAVHGDKRVQLDEMSDAAGCAAALERGLDDTVFDTPKTKGGLIVCVRSDQGRLSILVVDPPNDDDRLPVQVTSFDR